MLKHLIVIFGSISIVSCTGGGGSAPEARFPAEPPLTVEQIAEQEIEILTNGIPEEYEFSQDEIAVFEAAVSAENLEKLKGIAVSGTKDDVEVK